MSSSFEVPKIQEQHLPLSDQLDPEPSRWQQVVARCRQTIGRSALALSLAVSGGAVAGTAAEMSEHNPPAVLAAETGGYPDWNKPCVAGDPTDPNSSYGKTEGAGYWCSGYQWGNSPSQQNSSRGYGYRNCTDFVAWFVESKTDLDIGGMSHATLWDNRAASKGLTVRPAGEAAQVGDIAHWEGNDAEPHKDYGHVGIVASIDPFKVVEYNGGRDGNYRVRTSDSGIDHYIAVPGLSGEDSDPTPPAPTSDKIHELGFVRTNHPSGHTELMAYQGSPYYTTLRTNTWTGYPAVSDPANVKPIAIDVNGDGFDELGFVRLNHHSGKAEIALYHGSPAYLAPYAAPSLTGYPAVNDPENVTPMGIDVDGDGKDELGFVRTNHHSGKSELVVYGGGPNYATLISASPTAYPAVSDPEHVMPIAIDMNNVDKVDELAFVRLNHWSGKAEILSYHGAPNYTTSYQPAWTGYPAISDSRDVVTPLALDVNGDGIDELAFVRKNHSSGHAEIVTFEGAPYYTTQVKEAWTGYPTVSDPQNVTVLPLRIPDGM